MAIPNRFFEDRGLRSRAKGVSDSAIKLAVLRRHPLRRHPAGRRLNGTGRRRTLMYTRCRSRVSTGTGWFINEPRLTHRTGSRQAGRRVCRPHAWNLAAGRGRVFRRAKQVGQDGAVWFSDWYTSSSSQPDDEGFARAGNAYESSSAIISAAGFTDRYKNARRRRNASFGEGNGGAIEALASDTCSGGDGAAAARRARQKVVRPAALALVRTLRRRDRDQRRRVHALWTLEGSARLTRRRQFVCRRSRGAEAPAAGVRNGAAAIVLPRRRRRPARCSRRTAAGSRPAHAIGRTLLIAEMPESTEVAPRLRGAKPEAGELHRKVAEPRVLHRREPEQAAFTKAYKADKAAIAYDALPWRCGSAHQAGLRLPSAKEVGADWKRCRPPANGI